MKLPSSREFDALGRASRRPQPRWPERRWLPFVATSVFALLVMTLAAMAVPVQLPPSIKELLYWLSGLFLIGTGCVLSMLCHSVVKSQQVLQTMATEVSLRRAMEDSLATGIRLIDMQGVIRYVNRAFCQMTGWTEAELVGTSPPYLYWPQGEEAVHKDRLHQMLRGEVPPTDIELLIRRPDGSTFDARLQSSALLTEDGKQIGWMASLTNISEPKRIRNELEAAHERFTRVLESLDAAVSVVSHMDADGNEELLFANRGYCQLFGAASTGHHRLRGRLAKSVDIAAGEVLDQPTARWFDVRAREINWVDGRAAVLQIATDITLRRGTDEILRQQQEKVQLTSRLMTMGEMASSLAHELNQPLTAISNYSEGLSGRIKAESVPADDLRAVLSKISGQAERAGRIIRRIREFVRRSEPRRRPTPAAQVVEDAIGFADLEARKRAISIVAHIDPHMPPLDIDPILIEQVLLNLLKNAVEAMESSVVRRIDVHVLPSGQSTMAEIAVIDRGTGIAPSQAANLFQPFFSTKSEGMGMGLNICRSIVEFHQGRLTVEPNPEPTGGTVMRFTLPLAVTAIGVPLRIERATS